jgi:hypothetical protein
VVKRWYNWCSATHKHEMAPDDQGHYVRHSDYLALQAALREALDAWEFNSDRDWTEKTELRIAKLRAQFLDEGTP